MEMVSTAAKSASPRAKRLVALSFGVAAITFLLCWRAFVSRSPSDKQLDDVIAWLRAKNLGIGYHTGLVLPVPLRSLSQDGLVDLFETSDARLIALLQTHRASARRHAVDARERVSQAVSAF